jgi:large subunit ribosomal protein L25
MESIKLNASKREISGKQVKVLRAKGGVPAVVYGHGIASRSLEVNAREFEKVFKLSGESSLIDLAVDGAAVKVLVQEVQYDPTKGTFVHVDFRQVNMKEKMEVEIPLKFVGEAPAVKELGATLVRALDAINVMCLPQDLVHEIEVSLTGLKNVDDAITVGDIKVPNGIEVLNDAGQIVAVINAAMTEDEMQAMEAKSGSADIASVKAANEEKKAAKAATDEAAKPAAAPAKAAPAKK